MLDARWKFAKRGELYLTHSWTQTDAGFDALQMVFSSDVPLALFPDGIPGPGDDLTSPLPDADYDMSGIHEYSNLDYEETRTTLGFTYDTKRVFGYYGAASLYDLSDDDPYLQNATGSVAIFSLGATWTY
jgi:hypothetical protein